MRGCFRESETSAIGCTWLNFETAASRYWSSLVQFLRLLQRERKKRMEIEVKYGERATPSQTKRRWRIGDGVRGGGGVVEAEVEEYAYSLPGSNSRGILTFIP
uniref:Uncharacterized protein n=1 Tax=Vespula pensylvanica TaxID=30213 RepID=A0A834UEH7_VESPE|nr:hypothetical protein H0235_002974 [Vespula pensylvanica]